MPLSAEQHSKMLSELERPLNGIDNTYLIYLALYTSFTTHDAAVEEELDAIKRPFVIDAITTVFNLCIQAFTKDQAKNQTKINLLKAVRDSQGANFTTFLLEKILIQAGQPATWAGLTAGDQNAANDVVDRFMQAYISQED